MAIFELDDLMSEHSYQNVDCEINVVSVAVVVFCDGQRSDNDEVLGVDARVQDVSVDGGKLVLIVKSARDSGTEAVTAVDDVR